MREGLSRPLWLAVIAAVFALPLFIGLSARDLENDEAIYSYAVDGIVEHGDWLSPRSSPHERSVFLEKPPLKFWIVAAPIAAGLLPHDEMGLRVWDAAFGGLAFLYVFAFGVRLAGPVCGVVGVLALFIYQPLLFEHGLRNNNMEAPLVLAYCGGVYHFLGWASSTSALAGRRQALAVMAYFYLGFMTKFVAVLFLPIVLGSAVLMHGPTRRRTFAEWKLWALAAALFLACAAPWFVYQQILAGAELWQTMLGAHVVDRFTVSIDSSHIRPWNYYYVTIFRELSRTGTVWLALAGVALIVVRLARERRLEESILISWLVLPLALISMGTSKIHHYAYPFLPPIALAAGYGPGWLAVACRQPIESIMRRFTVRYIDPRHWGRGVRYTLVGLACGAIVVAAGTLAYGELSLRVGGREVLRNSHVARPLLLAFVLAAAAGRGVDAARWLLPVAVLIALVPSSAYVAYRATYRNLTRPDHSMRAARDCLMRVRAEEQAAGGTLPGIYAVREQRWMLHSHFYYFRRLAPWERADALDDGALAAGLFTPGRQRPVLIGDGDYQAFSARHAGELLSVPAVRLRDALLVMPGPYAVCAPAPGAR